jgi:hypothetical protein
MSTSNEVDMGNLSKRILFLTINCKRFGNLRTAKVEVKTDADQARYHTNKKLLNSPELNTILKRDGDIKESIEKFLLPYEIGTAILPVASAVTVKEILKSYRDVERPALVDAFVKAYPGQVKDAAVQLKSDFNPTQYLPVEKVVDEFAFSYKIVSLNLPEELKEEAYAQVMAASAGIADALATGAHMLVSKLADSLSTNSDGKPKKICDVHFTKLQEFLAGFDIRNVTNSAELKAEMDVLKGIMNGVDPELVRNNDGMRADIAAKLNAATTSLTAMVESKGRKFREPAKVPAV